MIIEEMFERLALSAKGVPRQRSVVAYAMLTAKKNLRARDTAFAPRENILPPSKSFANDVKIRIVRVRVLSKISDTPR